MSNEVPSYPMDSETHPVNEPPTMETPAEPAESEPARDSSPFTDIEPEAAAEPATAAVSTLAPQAEPVPEAAPSESAGPNPLELYFLRHADAGDPMTWAGDDADRPLSKKGRRQAKRLARVLADLNFRADAVLTSPRLRSADTARIVAKAIGKKAHADDRLGIDFGEETLAGLVAEWDADVRKVLLVGHDPDFTHLVSWLVGASITMRKGALARLDLADRTVSAGHASLRWLLPPDAVAG